MLSHFSFLFKFILRYLGFSDDCSPVALSESTASWPGVYLNFSRPNSESSRRTVIFFSVCLSPRLWQTQTHALHMRWIQNVSTIIYALHIYNGAYSLVPRPAGCTKICHGEILTFFLMFFCFIDRDLFTFSVCLECAVGETALLLT